VPSKKPEVTALVPDTIREGLLLAAGDRALAQAVARRGASERSAGAALLFTQTREVPRLAGSGLRRSASPRPA
jgi:hypothetical protein